MKARVVPSSWLRRPGLRLGAAAYTSGAIEARQLLDSLSRKSEALIDVTHGHQGGIYRPPIFQMQFSRNLVDSASHGVPFLTSTAMLLADLRNLPLVSGKVAQSKKFGMLRLSPGMTLISCSGTIGRAVYSRPDMDGVWSSQDIIKINPDPQRVPPGYVFAFLSSRFGVPLLTSGTYGAIIKHIEREHLLDVPMPRLGNRLEQAAHKLVEEAAARRCEASANLANGIDTMEKGAGLPSLEHELSPTPFSATTVSSGEIQRRFDAFFHSRYHSEARDALCRAKVSPRNVAELSEQIFEPARFKRVEVEDPEFGIPFFGTAALMWAEPTMSYLLARSTKDLSTYIVDANTLLIPRSGQLAGIIGTAVLPYGDLVGGAVSEDAIRIRCRDENDAGYLLIALSSAYGVRQLKARACGSSIPHLDVTQVGEVLVPDLSGDIRDVVAQLGASTARLRAEAIALERRARSMVEEAIERAA